MNTTKRILVIIILTIITVTAVFVTMNIVSNNTPEKQLSLAYKLLEEGKYEEAIIAFNKVIDIDEKNINARIGLSKVYVKMKDYNNAEIILNEALEINPKNQDVYKELIGVYELSNKYHKINELIEKLESIQMNTEADKYRPVAPTANIANGSYDHPIEILLSGDGVIYYTYDGTEPTLDSVKFQDPIKLDKEGTHQIKAMVINDNGIRSKIETFTYTLNFKVLEPPTSNLNPDIDYKNTQYVTLSNPNSKGTVLYSTDGKTPYKKYNGVITVDKNMTIKALCIDESTGQQSEEISWKYQIINDTKPVVQSEPQSPSDTVTPIPVTPTPTPTLATQTNESPFVDVIIQNGTGYTMQKFFSELFGFDAKLSDMRGVGIQIDEYAWTKEVSQSEWDTWMKWRKQQYGY